MRAIADMGNTNDQRKLIVTPISGGDGPAFDVTAIAQAGRIDRVFSA
jgi:hypothetical protein